MSLIVFWKKVERNMADILTYIIAGITALGIAFAAISYYLRKKRSGAVAKIARDMNLSYDETAAADMGFMSIINKINGNPGPGNALENFLPDSEILKWGRSRSVENLISGKISGREWKAFDYCYTTSSGRSSHRHCQTVFVSRLQASAPSFVLGPEGFFDKVGDIVLKQDIDFENYPEFSKKYFLKGQDKNAVKSLFSPELIKRIEGAQKKIALQSDGKMIAYFVPGEKAKPQEWPKHIEEASRVFDLIDKQRKGF